LAVTESHLLTMQQQVGLIYNGKFVDSCGAARFARFATLVALQPVETGKVSHDAGGNFLSGLGEI
jgi:hypothetical protein